MTSAPLLLVIDDGTLSRGDFISKMEQEGFRITAATGGQEGIALSQQAEPSAILVSPDIPDLSRDAVLRVLTRSQPAPVIALSSSDDESEAVLALEMGAVDVLTRPWRTRESAARIWAAVGAAPRPHVGAGAGAGVGGGVSEGATEPSATHPDSLLAAGPVELNLDRREVRIRGIKVPARPKDIDLLGLLVSRAGHLVPRESSLRTVWPALPDRGKVLDVQIRRLRGLVEKDVHHPRHIITVRCYGHLFEP